MSDIKNTIIPFEEAIPDVLPILPLMGIVAFPLTVLPLSIHQARSIQLVDEAMQNNRLVLLVTQRHENHESIEFKDLYDIGTIATIHQVTRVANGNVRLVVQGLYRAKVKNLVESQPYLIAKVEKMPDQIQDNREIEALRWAVLDLFQRLVGLIEGLSNELAEAAKGITDIVQLAYLIALATPFTLNNRQELLELDPFETKLHRLIECLQHEITVRELGQKITSETQERLSKSQREYFLREQVRSIQKELGEGNEQPELTALRERLEKAGLPEEALQEAERELKRFGNIPVSSPEYSMIHTYLEWMITLPWNKVSNSKIDIQYAKQILDEDHYDLIKVKERILEYLAVRKLRSERHEAEQIKLLAQDQKSTYSYLSSLHPQLKGMSKQPTQEPILCLVGPPGVGKTSLGQSVARALGRAFIRISLGGVHDESDIRGHRRTYIGALPGRIIQELKRCGMQDPVFMLDEIDKLGKDWRGDPAAALLEVLDPGQNHSFVDHYLGVPFNLSNVLFIATANTLDNIPAALLDRLEILRLSGYIDEEKIHIAEKYLIPKQLIAHGLLPQELSFNQTILQTVIRGYTREAGVRNLDREIATICRKIAKDIAAGYPQAVSVTSKQLENYLGRPHFYDEVAERIQHPGVATGLAWTPTGGDVLFVEASMMPSAKEDLLLTGMLGNVMKESAQTALSYIRSNTNILNIDAKILENKTIHLHVPAGAIPKDGPSAGVTIIAAIVSLVTKRMVKNNIAMTGEITLRGKLLPVGGIKEKILAAHRAGVKIVILPARNERDLEDVPQTLQKEMHFIFVDTIEAMLQNALDILIE